MRAIKCLFILFGLFCISVTASFAQTSAVTTENQTVIEEDKTIKVKVKGVGCSRDIKAILNNVGSVIGVKTCETVKKGATTTFSVTFNPSVASEKAIYTAVEATPGCSNQTARPYKVKL